MTGASKGLPPDGAWAQWPIFKDVAGVDEGDITIESIGFPVREPMLANGDFDGVVGFTSSVTLNLRAQGTPEAVTSLLRLQKGAASVRMGRTGGSKPSPFFRSAEPRRKLLDDPVVKPYGRGGVGAPAHGAAGN